MYVQYRVFGFTSGQSRQRNKRAQLVSGLQDCQNEEVNGLSMTLTIPTFPILEYLGFRNEGHFHCQARAMKCSLL